VDTHIASMPHARIHTKSQWYYESPVNPGKAKSH
jgi:hypothetical protein